MPSVRASAGSQSNLAIHSPMPPPYPTSAGSVSSDGDNPHAHPGQVFSARNPSDTSDIDLFVTEKVGQPFRVQSSQGSYGGDTDHGSICGSPTTSVGGLTFSTASIGHTNSSPLLDPTDRSKASDWDESEDLVSAIQDWHLADEVFGDLLEDPQFPCIYDKQFERHITLEQWFLLRDYLVDHEQLLRYFWFRYDKDMNKLKIISPSGLHQMATMSMAKSISAVLEPTICSNHQHLKVDGERLVINKFDVQKADCMISVCFSFHQDTEPAVAVHNNSDLILVQTSYTQSLNDVLHKIYNSMPSKGPMPVAYVILNIEESDYINDGNTKPECNGFIPGGGDANDLLSTGWKKYEKAYIGQIRAQWLLFRGTVEERAKLKEGLQLKWTVADWVRDGFGVFLCRKYDVDSVLQDQHDRVLAKWKEVMQECTRIIGVQARLSQLDLWVAGLAERPPLRPQTLVPVVHDPFPFIIDFIWTGANQKAMDDHIKHRNHDTSFAPLLPDAEYLERVITAMKRTCDDDNASSDDVAVINAYKRMRASSPCRSPSAVSDSSLEERSSDPVEPESPEPAKKDRSYRQSLHNMDLMSMATSRTSRSDLRPGS